MNNNNIFMTLFNDMKECLCINNNNCIENLFNKKMNTSNINKNIENIPRPSCNTNRDNNYYDDEDWYYMNDDENDFYTI